MRDPFVRQRQYEKLSKPTGAGAVKTWEIDTNGLLRWSSAVYMLDDPAVKAELLQANHNDLLGRQFGVMKTLEILHRKYFWESIRKYVKGHVLRHAKYTRQRSIPYNEVYPTTINARQRRMHDSNFMLTWLYHS
jgi:Integrase zinc binding domain